MELYFHLSILLHGVQYLIRCYFTFILSHVTPGSFVAQIPQMQVEGKGNVHPCTGTRLCTGRTAHKGSRGIAVLFHDHGTRRG